MSILPSIKASVENINEYVGRKNCHVDFNGKKGKNLQSKEKIPFLKTIWSKNR